METIRAALGAVPFAAETSLYVANAVRGTWGKSLAARLSGNRLPSAVDDWRRNFQPLDRGSNGRRRKVLFFTGGLKVLEHSLATAVVLGQRGCDVDFVWFDRIALDKPPNRYTRRKFDYYYGAALGPHASDRLGSLTLRPLPSLPLGGEKPEMRTLAMKQALLDLVYLTRRDEVDICGSDQELYSWRTGVNLDCIRRICRAAQDVAYDCCVIPNGRILEYGAAFGACQMAELPVGSYEFWSAEGTGVVSFGPCVMEVPTESLWDNAQREGLTAMRRERAAARFQSRAKTQQSGRDPRQIRQLLSLRDDKPTVLVCPNVPFDSLFVGASSLFSTMREWLTETVRFLLAREDVQVVVRAHPHERKYGGGSASDIIREFLGSPSGLRFLAPDNPISTYDLMGMADLGLVFSSTAGLEMAVTGLPVINCVAFHYGRKGFTHDPATREGYFQLIDKVILSPNAYRLTPAQHDAALLYFDVYCDEFPVPFPWRFEDLWRRLSLWPPHRVASDEGNLLFGKTFDRLIGAGV